ncbi:hypothetical protein CIW48_07215 [Methylobacterium sp. P1-11]|nr:hypothetical protein CIW48_07215 [Methylobacterium sp. P1-11]
MCPRYWSGWDSDGFGHSARGRILSHLSAPRDPKWARSDAAAGQGAGPLSRAGEGQGEGRERSG